MKPAANVYNSSKKGENLYEIKEKLLKSAIWNFLQLIDIELTWVEENLLYKRFFCINTDCVVFEKREKNWKVKI